jgi:TatD DNase family protein
LSISIVDTHCHLNFDDFDQDRNLVVDRARQNGISRILNPGIDIETSKSALICAHTYSEVYAAVGVHPNTGLSWTKQTLSDIRLLAGEAKVRAIGEIGLDHYRDWTPRELQQSIFKQQLELAAELELPVIIHTRDATEEMLSILQEWHKILQQSGSKLSDRPGVMHSFSGDLSFAQEVVALNFKIGITGSVTFNKSQRLQSVVTSQPLENIFIETDAPYITPHPFRGKRNEPANVRIVAEQIAKLKDDTLDNIAKITTAGADELFRWREIH